MSSHLCSGLTIGLQTKSSAAIDRGAAPRSKSVEFFICNPIVNSDRFPLPLRAGAKAGCVCMAAADAPAPWSYQPTAISGMGALLLGEQLYDDLKPFGLHRNCITQNRPKTRNKIWLGRGICRPIRDIQSLCAIALHLEVPCWKASS